MGNRGSTAALRRHQNLELRRKDRGHELEVRVVRDEGQDWIVVHSNDFINESLMLFLGINEKEWVMKRMIAHFATNEVGEFDTWSDMGAQEICTVTLIVPDDPTLTDADLVAHWTTLHQQTLVTDQGAPLHHYDTLLKILFIGGSSVGKTELLVRLADDVFNGDFISRIGVDFKIVSVDFERVRVKIQLWDTAGQDRFRTVTDAYWRMVSAIFLVYDTNDRNTFEYLHTWFRNITRHDVHPSCVLIGHTLRGEAGRVVTHEDGLSMAKQYGASQFLEVNAQTGENCAETLLAAVRAVFLEQVNVASAHYGVRYYAATLSNHAP